MKKSKKNGLLTLSFIIFCIALQTIGCSQDSSKKDKTKKTVTEKKDAVKFVSPAYGDVFKCGDSIPVELEIKKKDNIDSVVLSSIHSEKRVFTGNFNSMIYPAGNRVGQKIIKAEVFYNDRSVEKQSVVVVLLSDIIPRVYRYQVLNTFPHDANAYTQGLVYDKGILYESTGQLKHSSIRKVRIKTGEIIKKVDLKPELFGEGIALYNDKIFQITWQNQTGFVYNKENLELVRTFDYAIDQGWGLTASNDTLYLTDGSSFLYTIEPEYFSQIGQTEVFDHTGRITELNELEYVNGKIFANVYGSTKIVIIDPKTGKVTGETDLKGLIPQNIPQDIDHVANGIAFNPETGSFYITGKLWPVLYEISLTDYF